MNYSSLYSLVDLFPTLSDPSVNKGYAPEVLVETVARWVETRSVDKVSQDMNIPGSVIRQWMTPESVIDAEGNEVSISWWHGVLEQVREYIRDNLEARLAKVTDHALEELEVRLRDGDTVLLRGGKEAKMPVKAKDLSTIAAQLLDRRHGLVKERTDKEALQIQSRRTQDAVTKRLQQLERYLTLTKNEDK